MARLSLYLLMSLLLGNAETRAQRFGSDSTLAAGKLGNALYDRGAIVRMDSLDKRVYLTFSGHEFGEGLRHIQETLRERKVSASFFFTGDFYRRVEFRESILGLRSDGHYLGPHSDKHLLYNSWSNRDSLLITRDEFRRDLEDNYGAMSPFGISRAESRVFLPPFEWYNDSISSWSEELGLTLVNFTPGGRTNADYTTPSMGDRYMRADAILTHLRQMVRKQTMNGFILLIHAGTDPERIDKLFLRLGDVIDVFRSGGYAFGTFH